MSIRKTKKDLPKVIVRAWGNEPVILAAHALDSQKNRVLVARPDAAKPISLPIAEVFDYQEDRFTALRNAYTSGDSKRLEALYAELLRDKSSCNKYQDRLRLAHEEKGQVANTRSAA
jgi:hypothetical protein